MFSPPDGPDQGPPKKSFIKEKKVIEKLGCTVYPSPCKDISLRYEYNSNDEDKTIGAVTCTVKGDTFAFSSGNGFKIIDFKTFNVLFTELYDNDQVRCMEYSKDDTLWVGTMNGMIYYYTQNFQIQEFFKNDYAILSITTSNDSSQLLFTNMDMTIYYFNIKDKQQISSMKGKAVSVDGILFDYQNRVITTSFEHITHIWDSQGKLSKAMVPIKEASFTNGKGYILNTKFGTFIADKKTDRKKVGETYVWDLDTEKQIFYFKSLDSTCMLLKDRKFIFDNGTEICIFNSNTNQLESRMNLSHDDISCMYGCNDYFLTGTVDGFLAIHIYSNLGNEIISLQNISDLHFSFK